MTFSCPKKRDEGQKRTAYRKTNYRKPVHNKLNEPILGYSKSYSIIHNRARAARRIYIEQVNYLYNEA